MTSFVINFEVDVFKSPGVSETFTAHQHLPGSDISTLEHELKDSVVFMLREIEEYLHEHN